MQIKPTLLLLFLFLCVSPAKSQQKIDSSYTKYFENTREIPFLHLNKTTFIEGESIWFNAYVFEQNSNKLHPTTSNLYVSVLNSNGDLKEQLLVHIKEGIGYGNIALDSTYTEKEYYIKARTNWMQNFNEDNAFVQKIKILTSVDDKQKGIIEDEATFFDFQVLPEGGHFIADALNSCGIIIKDKNGKGQQVKGVIKEEKSSKIVSPFTTNRFGLGKVYFEPNKTKTYRFEAILENGTILSKSINQIRNLGIQLQVNNPNSQFIEVTLLTNKWTLKNSSNKTFTIWIHNTKKYYKNSITFEKKEIAKTLLIKNDKLEKGVNIITVFDHDNNPVAERIIFNYSLNLFTKVTTTSKEILGDSITISIANPTNTKMFLSASFLPSETKAYDPVHTIISKFTLSPYIKGTIENPGYYFNNTNRKKLNELDLLLMTQGWSKYNWETIFKDPPRTDFEFENGMDVTITINQKLRKNQRVLLFSNENNLIREIKQESNPFILENSFLKKDTYVNFSLNREQIYLEIEPTISYSNTNLEESLNLEKISKTMNRELQISNFSRLAEGREMLDEITITSKVKKWDNSVRSIGGQLRRYDAKDLVVPSRDLIDYIKQMFKQYGNSNRPLRAVYLNNNRVRSAFEVDYIRMDEVREVAFGIPFNGEFRELHIYTFSPVEYNKVRVKSKEIKIPVGFALEKNYYEPKYPSYTNETFYHFGALYWQPNIIIEPNSNFSMNIPLHFQNGVTTCIEGIDEDGRLISTRFQLEK